MTHGEEPCPETQQDSAVLTYLEGLLMHPVASGPGATATGRLSGAGNGHGELGGRGAGDVRLPEHSCSSLEKGGGPAAGSQHLKKVRLLGSGAWGKVDAQNKAPPVLEVNGQGGDHRQAATEGTAAGESTLLASLLQSFSSRLQTVAMSQCVPQGQERLDGEGGEGVPTSQQPFPGYCTASSRLRGLMRRNKQPGPDATPYSRRRDRRSDSPRSSRGAAAEAVSCAERLKAVASLVKNRPSPAPSPKPSAACSQLALLLSSEAHLQEYSREQALKAQLSGRLASERLAAMATMQTNEHRPPSVGESRIAPDMLSSFNALNGTLPSPTSSSTKRSPSLTIGQSASDGSPQPVLHPGKEKRPFDRHGGRPPQTCSSLLLLLLNNHNSQKPLTKNGHLDDEGATPPSRASSRRSDSDCSNLENSLTKDGSDVESCYSSCSPIDLSVRSRGSSQKSEEPSSASASLDKFTETLLNKWKPETPGPKVPEAMELETSPNETSLHKVTLMQLLLDRRNNEKVNTVGDNPDLQHDATLSTVPAGPFKQLSALAESRTEHPLERLRAGGVSTSVLTADTSSNPSPFSYSSPFGQSSPLDLCKSKHHPREKVVESTFSASKLLQNLAQCGLQNPSPSPPLQASRPPSKRQSPELELDRPQTLLDRLVAPVRNKTPLFEPPPATFAPFGRERSPPASAQIENLLERRTILQLLLGTASHKEKPVGRRSVEAATGASENPSGAPVIWDDSNGPLPNVRIKTEPAEETLLSDSSDDGGRRRRWGCERHRALAEAHDAIKAEGCPADAAAKYGLLSQLLKQQSATCHLSPHKEPPVSTVKEEQQDYQGALPKKRRLCLELAEHLSSELCQRPLDTVNERLVSGALEEHNSMRLLSPKEEDSFIKCPASKAPPRESQGFNVLKQLLLSDNCLKELSQPRGAASPFLPQVNCKANGNFSQFSYNPEPMNLPWFPQTLNSGPSNLQTLSSPLGNSSQGSPWPKGSPKPSPTCVKTETESSPRWAAGSEGKCESSPHSPPLTRSNPILYYMLQRGSASLRKGMEDLGQRTHCGVTVKEEPCTDARYHEHRESVHSSPIHSGRHSNSGEHLSGSLKKS
ncbi:nuclear receptor-interacting protein 1 [Brachyhypopomus gauderio]|uniref:nuclear receptor-interacting protein 1 n=1 Tax=Brachyhypopomus gauderio TaxID=698409 RepID=UPI004040ED48